MSGHTIPVIFFGNEKLCTGLHHTNLPTLNLLLKNNFEIVAIFAPQKQTISRTNNSSEIYEFAKHNNIEIFSNARTDEILEVINQTNAKIGVLAAYGKLVPQTVIDSFEYGILNIHPSLLPKYRGSTPIESTILNGDNFAGVSIMKLVKEMDEGPIYKQEKISIDKSISKQSLADKLGGIGAKLLVETINDLLNTRDIKPTPQNNAMATYCNKISTTDGLIDTNKAADVLANQVRAYSGWPKSKFVHKDLKLIILEAKASNLNNIDKSKLTAIDNKLYIGCKNGALEILKLQIEGKNAIDAQAFINGYKNKLA